MLGVRSHQCTELTDLPIHLSELLEFNISRGLSQDETILLSWKDSSSYLSAYWVQNDSSGPCGWSGIGCEEWRGENRVTAVHLPSLGLAGPIPPNVCSLSALKVQSHCSISGFQRTLGQFRLLAKYFSPWHLSMNWSVGMIPWQ